MKLGDYESPDGQFFDTHIEASLDLNQFSAAVRIGYDTVNHSEEAAKRLFALKAMIRGQRGDDLSPPPQMFDEHLRRFAAKEGQTGYQFMQQVVLVRLASIVEVGVNDMVAHVREFRKTKGVTAAKVTLDKNQGTRAQRFEASLTKAGLAGQPSAIVNAELDHLFELRNVIVHRQGLVDEALVCCAANAGYEIGTTARFGENTMIRFLTAARAYLFDLMVRWDSLYYEICNPTSRPDPKPLVEFRDRLVADLNRLAAQ